MLHLEMNTVEILAKMEGHAKQVAYATMVALNKTAEQAKSEMLTEVDRVFDRPSPWVRNSLRIKYATKANLAAEVAFKDKNSAESSRSMLEPHAFGGKRHYKTMEARLLRVGILPAGWNAVPGAAAQLDSFGNMSQGQITTILNVLGTYTEAGYNKANEKTVERLKKGNKKKGTYGYEYFVSYGSTGRTNVGIQGGAMVKTQVSKNHLPPGIWQRVNTGFGSSLKPVLMFVKQANYKTRFDFYAIGRRVVDRDLQGNFTQAIEMAIATARSD